MSKLTPADLQVGFVLAYKGDEVPFVEAKHLISKGHKTGRWLLPSYQKNDATPSGVEWKDVPGNKSDRYVIVRIERNRTDKRGKPLADLIHIKGDGYLPSVFFALLPGDVCAKFTLVGDDPSKYMNKADPDVVAVIASREAVAEALHKLQKDGW